MWEWPAHPTGAAIVARCSDATPLVTRTPGVPSATKAEDAGWAKTVKDAQKEGRVLVYAFVFAGDVGAAVSKAFKDKYGITMDIVAGSSPVLLERIRSEYRAGQSLTDIAEMSSSRTLSLKYDKLTVSVKDLPVMQDRANWYTHPLDLDPDGHVLSYYISVNPHT